MLGELLGNYRVLRKLGEGGMGVVFLAEHQHIGKRAAVKVLLPHFSANQDIVQRFFNEARATTLLRHPGLIDVFDFGYHASGSAYIAMEFLEGESLADRLRLHGTLPLETCVLVARQVASALGAAHGKGIVHRDLKPDNVFLVPEEDAPGGIRVKVLDFGIAKLSDEAAGSVKTLTGAVMGTPTYMSPEQCRSSGNVDGRSDVYALGCMLFHLVSGRPPFVGEGTGEVLAAHIHVAPPELAMYAPHAPAWLCALVGQTLAKAPGDRPQVMAEVIRALDQGGAQPFPVAPGPTLPAPVAVRPLTTLSGATGEPARSRTPRRGFVAPIVAGGAVVLAGALVALLSARPIPLPAVALSRLPAAAPAAAPSPPPPPDASLPDAPLPDARIETVTVRIESEPSGATVWEGDRELGATPLELVRPRDTGTLQVRLTLRGHKARTLDVPLAESGTRTVKLARPCAPPSKNPLLVTSLGGEKPCKD